MSSFSYFKSPIVISICGLALSFMIGWRGDHSLSHAISSVCVCAILGVLEVSLSFDNAVVNAKYLDRLSPQWRHRFLTWGMVIAVIGVRLILPLIIVGVIARIDPFKALALAALDPDKYALIIKQAHLPVAGFGGAFLLMVALKYFFDPEKSQHWLRAIETRMARIGKIRFVELFLVTLIIFGFSRFLPRPVDAKALLIAGAAGLFSFVVVDFLSLLLERTATARDRSGLRRASLGVFLYLEVLDASFSFDGVIGAFAISDNLFIITIGLGVGAMFVRSLTMLFVDRGTLKEYKYLENGAFYAIAALGSIMLINTLIRIPELVTGLIGASLIGLAFWSSLMRNRKLGDIKD